MCHSGIFLHPIATVKLNKVVIHTGAKYKKG